MYNWLFTSVRAELEKNFPDDGETFEMTEFVSEEIWCNICNYGTFPTKDDFVKALKFTYFSY